MDIQTFSIVRDLHTKYRPGIFGKIAQKLLALGFRELGYTHVVERSVEGVDIDVAGGGLESLALEVKTAEGRSFQLSKSNIDALRDRIQDGYQPVIAALRLSILEDWIISKPKITHLSPGEIFIDNLRPYRDGELEDLINPAFDKIVMEHQEGAMKGGLAYLSEQLRNVGVEVRE